MFYLLWNPFFLYNLPSFHEEDLIGPTIDYIFLYCNYLEKIYIL